ncbi:MAG: ribbon-helix-helix protein, CopG family [Alphaproteobacteria bacterium]
MTNISFRPRDAKLAKEIDAVAERLDRSRSWVINSALEAYVERQKEIDEGIRKAIKFADENPTAFVPHDEVVKRVKATIQRNLTK